VGYGTQFWSACAQYRDLVAIVSNREQVTYAQLVLQADNVASHFHAAGVRPGQRVGIALQESLDTLVAILACWRLSATAAVIDFRAPRIQRAGISGDFGLGIVFESFSPPGSEQYPALRFASAWRHAPKSGTSFVPQADDAHPAFLLFTSGTTGAPKAYVQSHELMLARIASRRVLLDAEEMRFLTPMALTYSATRHQIFGYLLNGGSIRLLPPLFSPSELAEELLAFRATGTALPPPVIARLVREAGARSAPLFPRLAVLASLGGPARAEDKVAAYLNLSRGYRQNYASGLTGMVSALVGEDVLQHPETTGRAVATSRIAIVDETGAELPTGSTGRIKAWTKTMATQVLLPGGIVTTDPKVMGSDWGIPGDLGYLDDEQFLIIVDREADIIVRGGVNVSPLELEKAIARHPKVIEVAVVGYPDDTMGQEIAAFIVADDGTRDEFARYVKTNIAPDRRPREIRLVPALPYSEHGKLLRRKLVELLSQRSPPENSR
jgi:long-chain acyl-CoA synthetase